MTQFVCQQLPSRSTTSTLMILGVLMLVLLIPHNVFALQYDGVDTAVSVFEGQIDVIWDEATDNNGTRISEQDDPPPVTYHVFVSRGDFDFESALDGSSIEDLRNQFEVDETKQYYNVTNDLEYSINSPYLGELHTILVTAEVDGAFSGNVLPCSLNTSAIDPNVKKNITAHLVPGSNLTITAIFEDSLPGDEPIEQNQAGELTITGDLLPFHYSSFIPGSFLSGFTSDEVPFLLNVTGVMVLSQVEAKLNVTKILLDAVFEDLDFHACSALSKDTNATAVTNDSSRRRHLSSALTSRTSEPRRRLIKVDDSFPLFHINPSFDIEFNAAAVKWTGSIGVRCDLHIAVRVGWSKSSAMAEVSLNYSMESRLEIEAAIQQNWTYDKELWKGKKQYKTIWVWFVPVIVDVYPKIDIKCFLTAQAQGEVSAHVEGSGGTSVGMKVDNNGYAPIYKPPTFTATNSFNATARLGLRGHVDLIFTGTVELYNGLLWASAGLSIGAGLEAELYLDTLPDKSLALYLKNLEFDFRYGIPIAAGSTWFKTTWGPTNVYNGTKPIITLPEAEITIEPNYICEKVNSTDFKARYMAIHVKEKADVNNPPLIHNGFSNHHPAKWHYGGDFLDPEWNNNVTGQFSVDLDRTFVGPSNIIPEQVGEVFAFVVPAFPGFAILPVKYQKDANLTEVTCPNSDTSLENGGGGGDPHFDTFAGVSYSYHGQCDLVMIHSQQFHSGLGLRIHIRTTRVDAAHISYSYISGVAIQIGSDVLEVMSDGSIIANGFPFFVNKELTGDFAGFPVHKKMKGIAKRIFVYVLTLSDYTSVQIRANTKTGLLFVDVTTAGHDLPSDTVGLLGSPASKNALLGRDGTTDLIGAWNNLGEDWQVAVDEPKLFQDKNRVPQSPVGCIYQVQKEKTNVRHRRRLMDLDGHVLNMEVAEKACKYAVEKKKEFCIDDVMAIGDLELAKDPFYLS